MSAVDYLDEQCRRRGWNLALTCSYPAGRRDRAGAKLEALNVVRHHSNDDTIDLLARVQIGSLDELERAAVEAALALERQGLIA